MIRRRRVFEREAEIVSVEFREAALLPPSSTECNAVALWSPSSKECNNSSRASDDVDNVLVFGCRKKTKDYYYADEWEQLTNSKRLHLIPAFSRDQKHKLYVQRALREADGGELIARHILDRRGAVYVAGGSKMARAVKDEIVEALAARLGGGERDAKRLLGKMKRVGLFSIEAWS